MTYDLIIAGGGLAGASLAKNMAERGFRVLVLEREKAFRDRIRGEAMHPWGIAQAVELGIYDTLRDACGHQARRWKMYFNGDLVSDRDLPTTNPHGVGELHFYHPHMQTTLLGLARSAGAEVRRDARVKGLGADRSVTWVQSGATHQARARLVVGADGSRSKVSRLAGFAARTDPDRLMIAGVLMENTPVPDDSAHLLRNEDFVALFFPQGGARSRTYVCYRAPDTRHALHGEGAKGDYLRLCRCCGVPSRWLEGARLTGPLAQFRGADTWVEHPARAGVVLIGDAAAKPDPAWGTGLSLTLLDVRTLRDELLATADWDGAVERYAREHDRYYQALHALESWYTNLLWDQGADADARRMHILPLMEQPGAPDIVGLGPDSPLEMPR